LPLNIFIVGWVISRIFDRYNSKHEGFRVIFRLIFFFFVLGLVSTNIPVLNDYYQDEKSYGREISQVLSNKWEEGNQIWV